MARAVLVGVPHHLTQRGLDRQPVFFTDADREVYLGLVRSAAARFGAGVLGYRRGLAAGLAGAGAHALVLHTGRVGCVPGIGYHGR